MTHDSRLTSPSCPSFSWSSFRMDRNMMTILSGQVVDFFDNDFRELYAVSEKLDLYKEFHISRPAVPTAPVRVASVESKRPPLPATTSRFQVSLGDSKGAGGDLKVPAHKYYNPKYQLAFGSPPGLPTSLQDVHTERGPSTAGLGGPTLTPEQTQSRASSERLDKLAPLPAQTGGAKKSRTSLRNFFRSKQNSQKVQNKDEAVVTTPSSSPTSKTANGTADSSFEDLPEPVAPKGKNRRLSKLGLKSQSLMTLNTGEENGEARLCLTTIFICMISISYLISVLVFTLNISWILLVQFVIDSFNSLFLVILLLLFTGSKSRKKSQKCIQS